MTGILRALPNICRWRAKIASAVAARREAVSSSSRGLFIHILEIAGAQFPRILFFCGPVCGQIAQTLKIRDFRRNFYEIIVAFSKSVWYHIQACCVGVQICDDAEGGRPLRRGISAEYVRFTNRAKEYWLASAGRSLCCGGFSAARREQSEPGSCSQQIRFFNAAR